MNAADPTPQMSIVACSLNGAEGVDRLLHAIAAQEDAPSLETILVDDGSSDGTADVGRRHGVTVIVHEHNKGLSAARNTGIDAASAPIVAFLDDDCEPEPGWAQRLYDAYDDDATGVGGVIVPIGGDSVIGRFLERHNPLQPLEADLADSTALPYRLWLYLRRQWRDPEAPRGRREAYALVGANMSFRRQALLDAGGFDERYVTGAEEVEIAMRVRGRLGGRLVIEPGARVKHHFGTTMGDALTHRRTYGRGSARSYRKWPDSGPTIFPAPLLAGVLLVAALRRPALLTALLAFPQVLFPGGVRAALRSRRLGPLLDPYIQLAQETADNAGFVEGWWIYRDLEPERQASTTAATSTPTYTA